ncbi:MAG: Maf family nucleotide pyrophosphatase [Burkholderiales bacterium]|jgi:septum formation protein|uniref:dTTP/UTP pyrophosphatase n=1 Tax=Candidatus Desulfobacillus denitrificans TaxID=2608985 RepID=A0A809RJ62_9PROT|nr:septum formation inhibitor Maf [Rhodocyclaceae bacterium]MCZ2173619.1 Maf family nucleotide pyrophosphatase [Burkholderiales bacterium]OQY74144.1 MAG: septum formation inhibitor Maf [Rhodocyclaceae bacterium UTPRO2]BBO19452.1 septum formation inhibitor Maf [Candidatus Desulfobacillus denitrificans]GIK45368.1 MAG: Maf-like protein [Betaproteobacteria bacterium]
MITLEPRIYLASRSPRRRELLAQIGVRFELLMFRGVPREDPDVDEAVLATEAPEDYVVRVTLAKARAGTRRIRERHLIPHPVLAADTTVEIDGHIIGKPEHEADAVAILQRLSGRTHRVLTAVALSDNGRTDHLLSISEVRFRPLEHEEIRRYVAGGEPLDKAGAYGIQGRAAIFVEEIRGSYTGIMGLPLYETALLLRRFGYPI